MGRPKRATDPSTSDAPELREIALRAFAVPVTKRKPKTAEPRQSVPEIAASDWVLIFDTETKTDASQQLRVGFYQLRRGGQLTQEAAVADVSTFRAATRLLAGTRCERNRTFSRHEVAFMGSIRSFACAPAAYALRSASSAVLAKSRPRVASHALRSMRSGNGCVVASPRRTRFSSISRRSARRRAACSRSAYAPESLRAWSKSIRCAINATMPPVLRRRCRC